MRFILGVVIGAVALFFWGFVFWMLMPYSASVIHTLPNQDTLVPALQDAIAEDGAHFVPGYGQSEELMAKVQAGPVATLLFRKGGAPEYNKTMINGFLHTLGCSFLMAIVVATAGRRTYFGRLMLVVWVGLFAVLWIHMSPVIWFHFPIEYACLYMTYDLIAVIILGIILAFFIRPPADPEID